MALIYRWHLAHRTYIDARAGQTVVPPTKRLVNHDYVNACNANNESSWFMRSVSSR